MVVLLQVKSWLLYLWFSYNTIFKTIKIKNYFFRFTFSLLKIMRIIIIIIIILILITIKQINDQINGFTCATEIPISFVLWFSWKFRSWMVLFGSLLNQVLSSFTSAYVLSILEIDADWFIDCSTKILINRFNGLETFFWSLIYQNPRSRFMLEWMVIFVSIKDFEARCSNSGVCWFNGGSDDTALLPLLILKTRSARMLDTMSYVRGHWFGCSFQPGTPFYSLWTLDSSALSRSLALPNKEQQL